MYLGQITFGVAEGKEIIELPPQGGRSVHIQFYNHGGGCRLWSFPEGAGEVRNFPVLQGPVRKMNRKIWAKRFAQNRNMFKKHLKRCGINVVFVPVAKTGHFKEFFLEEAGNPELLETKRVGDVSYQVYRTEIGSNIYIREEKEGRYFVIDCKTYHSLTA